MTNDCLVTKLKATVNNSNLEKLGILDFKAIKLDSVSINTQQKLEIHSVGDYTIKVSSPGQFVLNDPTNFNIPSACYTELVLNATNASSTSGGEHTHIIYFANETYDINIIDKHNVVGIKVQELSYDTVYQFDFTRFRTYPHLNFAQFGTTGRILGGDIDYFLNTDITNIKMRYGVAATGSFENLKGSTALTNLYFEYCNRLTGSIDALKDCVNLTQIHLKSCANIVGNIATLAKLINLTEASFGNSKVGGAVEDFVSGQIANGRTTETTGILSGNLIQSRTIAGFTSNAESENQWLCWDSADKFCVYSSSSLEANPVNKDACTRILVNDAAQFTTEIPVWKAAGKTVIDCKTGTIV